MTNPEEKVREEKGKTEKLASNFGETVKRKKEKEINLKKENERKEKGNNVRQIVRNWETEREKVEGQGGGTLPPRTRRWSSSLEGAGPNRPGEEVRQNGGGRGKRKTGHWQY